jgi:hypothetical protein
MSTILGQSTMNTQDSSYANDRQMNSPSNDQDSSRGRRQTREPENGDASHADLGDGTQIPGSRKRRRSRKGEKKFECPHDGCGRSYSRAEHLYRHQLNRKFSSHTPHGVPTSLYVLYATFVFLRLISFFYQTLQSRYIIVIFLTAIVLLSVKTYARDIRNVTLLEAPSFCGGTTT